MFPDFTDAIRPETSTFQNIQRAAGTFFEQLFVPAISYKPIAGLRAEAQTLLGRNAAKLIRLCEAESVPRVSFQTASRMPRRLAA